MAVRLAAWNPSNANQFAQYQNRLELWNIEQDEGRKAKLYFSLKAQSLLCFEWQNKGQHAMMAYGTSAGSVHLVNWEQRQESLLGEDANKVTKRSCHSIAWNHLDSHRLAAGFEVSKR